MGLCYSDETVGCLGLLTVSQTVWFPWLLPSLCRCLPGGGWLKLPVAKCLVDLAALCCEVVDGLFATELRVVWIVRLNDLDGAAQSVVLRACVDDSDSASYGMRRKDRTFISPWPGIPIHPVEHAPGFFAPYAVVGGPVLFDGGGVLPCFGLARFVEQGIGFCEGHGLSLEGQLLWKKLAPLLEVVGDVGRLALIA